MNDDSQNQQKSYAAKKSADLRERRKAAGVVQVVFYIREQDKAAAAAALRDLTDKAWLALFEAGAIERRDDPSRAAEIRARLQLTPSLETNQHASGHPNPTEENSKGSDLAKE